jgi:DNA recombination protein RmuC
MSLVWLIALVGVMVGALIGYLLGMLRAARRAESLRVELESTRAKLTSEGEQRARTAELLAQAQAQVGAAVESASRAALNSNSETFLKLAREVFGHDQVKATASLKEREEAIRQLVEPIRAALVKQETQALEIERLRAESHGKLSGQIEGLMNVQSILQRETRNLSTALRRLVELSGMVEHCDFTEQTQVQAGEKVLRPDLIVRMPEARELVVDAKTPLDAYMDAVEANDDDSRRTALARHAQQVEQRVRELGQKSYWEQFEHSPEFAVLFLPGDQFLSAALAERPDLLDSALKQSIIIATPSTLMALLKVVAYGWRQAAASQNAAEIRELGQELHRRLATFVGHLQKVGRSLDNALGAYNSAVGSFERNVSPQARRFSELGATPDVLPAIEPAEQVVRLPQATSPDGDEPAQKPS